MATEKRESYAKWLHEDLKKPIRDIQLGFKCCGSINILGFPSDMMLFFDCIKFYVEDKYKDEDWSVITDRLYKRYLREEDIDIADEKMKKIEEIFKELPIDAVDWSFLDNSTKKTTLNPNGLNSLYEVFEKYFLKFYERIDGARYSITKGSFGYYQPLRVIIFTFPYDYHYEQIPLSEFDALTDKDPPKWFVANTHRKVE
jgi:hypothetical protein